MTDYPDPVAAAIGELDKHGQAIDQLGETMAAVFEHGTELVDSRRRLAQLLGSVAREQADLMEEREHRARLHAAEMREATRRREVAEHRAATLEQALRNAGVEYAPGMRVRIGKCIGTVLPDVATVRVRLDGGVEAGRFAQEFVHHLPISDAEAAAQVKAQDAADGVAPAAWGPEEPARQAQEFEDKADQLARHHHTVHMVRRLAELASHWQFGRDGHLWQGHEKRDFAKWLREQANKINKGEELGL
jgi:hypothetical protein